MAGVVSRGEVAKTTYEDLEVLLRGVHSADAGEALERVLRRVLRALVNPSGETAYGVAQGIGQFEGVYLPIKELGDND